jgi:hypothetical protein
MLDPFYLEEVLLSERVLQNEGRRFLHQDCVGVKGEGTCLWKKSHV